MALRLPFLPHPVRAAARTVAARWPFPVAVDVEGLRLYVDLRSSIGRGILATGEFDEAVFAAIAEGVSASDTVIDVGANIGFYSARLANLVGAKGQVHAFEIDPRAIRCLRRTLQRNSIGQLRLHEFALGSSPGTVFLDQSSEVGHTSAAQSGSGRPVECETLDSWASKTDLRSLAVIKIDVEGGEVEVLRGAAETVHRLRPRLVIEVVDSALRQFGSSAEELFELLRQWGYRYDFVVGAHTPCIVACYRGG